VKNLNAIVFATVFLAAGNMASAGAAAEGEKPDMPSYTLERASEKPKLDGDWEGAAWKNVPALDVVHFYRTDLSDHRPKTQAKAVFDDLGIYIHFRVEDRYVRSVETKYHGKVWEDACVEFFVQPRADRGYFNFEINCGGTMLLSYQESPEWKGDSLRRAGRVPWRLAKDVTIFHSMPETVEPEQAQPVVWQVEYFIPFEIFETNLGELGPPSGQTWRANFYKCAENNSHPHWASWAPIGKELNFHVPNHFAPLHFVE